MSGGLRERCWVVALWLTSACSVLVDPETLVIKCEVMPGRESDDPCLAAGLHCVSSVCKPCPGASEICNGIDDDCDGVIDNGHDQDHDGFTWCGGGVAALADCAPNDATIHPASMPGPDGVTVPAPKEACDGKDNDCDSKVDEAAECEPMHSCVQDGCQMGQTCDMKTGVCIEPRPVGSGCRLDSECARGFCVRPGDFGLAIELMGNRCATACCQDGDCAEGSVCVVSSTGSRMCLPANIVGRGNKSLGERCNRDLECSSGSCDRSGCVGLCFADDGCRAGSACTLSPGGQSIQRLFMCTPPAGREPAGAFCTQILDIGGSCRSGLCTDRNACAAPCGRNEDCGMDQVCNYAMTRPVLSTRTSVISFCVPRALAGGDELCCTSADCGEGHLCAPKAIDDSKLLVMSCK